MDDGAGVQGVTDAAERKAQSAQAMRVRLKAVATGVVVTALFAVLMTR